MIKIKNCIKFICAHIMYFFYKHKIFSSKLKACSIDDTIDFLLESSQSLVRFGDGEIALMRGIGIKFQEFDKNLQKDLINIAKSNLPIAIPDVFQSLEQYENKTKQYWIQDMLINRKRYNVYFDDNRDYFNAFVSRLYMPFMNYSLSKKWYSKIKKLWEDKDILIVEGEQSRLGVGNDLFSNCKSIKRIICPPTNSYSKIDDILKAIIDYNDEKLVLIALGPTAKVLVAKLYEINIRAIDIGHIDIEYEWFIAKAKDKIVIKTKYTNESEQVSVEGIKDYNYSNQIICYIKS